MSSLCLYLLFCKMGIILNFRGIENLCVFQDKGKLNFAGYEVHNRYARKLEVFLKEVA